MYTHLPTQVLHVLVSIKPRVAQIVLISDLCTIKSCLFKKRYCYIHFRLHSQTVGLVSHKPHPFCSAAPIASGHCDTICNRYCEQKRHARLTCHKVVRYPMSEIWSRGLRNTVVLKTNVSLPTKYNPKLHAPSFPSLAVWKSGRGPGKIYHTSNME